MVKSSRFELSGAGAGTSASNSSWGQDALKAAGFNLQWRQDRFEAL
jgi:hypothetical protein